MRQDATRPRGLRAGGGRAVLLAVLVFLAAPTAALAEWWLDPPAGYQGIGGAGRLGPYATWYDAQRVNNEYFQGQGYVWGSDDPDPDRPEWRYHGTGVVTLRNKTGWTVNVSIRRRADGGWVTRRIAPGHSWTEWQDLPAAFAVRFDGSYEPGFQAVDYDLDHNTVQHTRPTAAEGRPYDFAETGTGLDLYTGRDDRPYAPDQEAARARAASEAAAQAVRRRGEEARAVARRLDEAREAIVAAARAIARARADLARAEVDRRNRQRLERLLTAEAERVTAWVAHWQRAHDGLAERAAAAAAGAEAALAEVRELLERAGVPAPAPDAPGAPGPWFELPAPALDADAVHARTREAAPAGPERPVTARVPVAVPVAPTAEELAALAARERRAQARRRTLEAEAVALRARVEQVEAAAPTAAGLAAQRERLLALRRRHLALKPQAAEALTRALAADARQAAAVAVKHWVLGRLPERWEDAPDLGEDLRRRLGDAWRYLSALTSMQEYAAVWRTHLAADGAMPALFRAMRTALRAHEDPALVARVERDLERRWGTFAGEMQRTALPPEVTLWLGWLTRPFGSR